MDDANRQGGGALVTIITLVVVAACLYLLREVFIPLALATLLTFLLSPLVNWLRRLGLPRVPAVVGTVLLTFLVIFSIGWLVTFQIYDLSQQLPKYRQTIQTKLENFKGPAAGWFERSTRAFRETAAQVSEQTSTAPKESAPEEKPIPVEVHAPKPSSLEMVRRVLGPAVHPIATAGLVVVFVIFMLLYREDLRDRLIRLAGTGRLQLTTQAFDEAGSRVSRYLLMQLVVNVTYGIPVGIGLYFIGVPNPLLWGILAMLVRFVPYLGPTIGAALPLFVAFAVDPGWSMLIWTGVMFLTIELLSNNFIEPWLYGSSTGLSPVAVIVAAVFWTWLWGPVGLLLSTPLTVCMAVLGRHVPSLSFLNILLSDEPVLSTEMKFYQRLLAGDTDEALQIMESFLKEKSVLELYDDVFIPALTLAERDRERGALGAEKEEFIYRSIREMVDEFDDRDEEGPDVCRVQESPQVLCLPAKDQADELAARMLTKAACRRGVRTKALAGTGLSHECLEELERQNSPVVCLSSVPPSGLRQVRYLCRRMRSHFPHVKLVVGAWGVKDEVNELKGRLTDCAPDGFVTSLKQALEQIVLATTATAQMTPAPVPANDRQRIAELQRLELLDTDSDELFDRTTQELARTFDVPIALMTLVDENRIFWKSHVGLPEDLLTTRESPRETSLCAHVVAANDVMVVPNLAADPRFANNPTVRERGLRFYAGAPLRTGNGHAIGTLCLMDTKPRHMREGEKRYLQLTADKLMAEVEARAATTVPA
jgi:predicted PurR-regulated permease PerM